MRKQNYDKIAQQNFYLSYSSSDSSYTRSNIVISPVMLKISPIIAYPFLILSLKNFTFIRIIAVIKCTVPPIITWLKGADYSSTIITVKNKFLNINI